MTNGEDIFLLKENESTFVRIGTVYALENPRETPLEIIEIQSGSYLGEEILSDLSIDKAVTRQCNVG